MKKKDKKIKKTKIETCHRCFQCLRRHSQLASEHPVFSLSGEEEDDYVKYLTTSSPLCLRCVRQHDTSHHLSMSEMCHDTSHHLSMSETCQRDAEHERAHRRIIITPPPHQAKLLAGSDHSWWHVVADQCLVKAAPHLTQKLVERVLLHFLGEQSEVTEHGVMYQGLRQVPRPHRLGMQPRHAAQPTTESQQVK